MSTINQRKATLYILQNSNQYASFRFSYNMSNKRSLNRLSTKQLIAKKNAWDKAINKQLHRYVEALPRLVPAFGGVTL
jgi:hypothetical protein